MDSAPAPTNLLDRLRQDYQRFPRDQSYELYAEDVVFQDPMTAFRGRDRYVQMIGWIQRFFLDCRMEVHDLQQPQPHQIRSDWTLYWRSPLPWKPAIAISGWSELELNEQGLIACHRDYWKCSRWDVVTQHFRSARS